jgi:hypothetical protein
MTSIYNTASAVQRKEWMNFAILFAIGLTEGVKCYACGRTIIGSEFVERKWNGHKYHVPVFNCACGESFGNWITEMVGARELHMIILQQLGNPKQQADLTRDCLKDLGDGIAKAVDYQGPKENGDALTAAVQDLADQLKIARRMLWMCYSQGTGYGDDGEMQWNGIDFKRERLQDIQDTIHKRGLEEFRKLGGARFIEQTKLQLEVLQAANAFDLWNDDDFGAAGELSDAVRKLREFNAQVPEVNQL